MTAKPDLSLVIPVINEEKAIGVVGLAVEGHGECRSAQLSALVLRGESPLFGNIFHPVLEHLAVVKTGGLSSGGE